MIFVGIAVAFFFLLGVLGSVLYLMFGVGEAVNQMPPQKILSEPDSPPVQSFVKTQPLKQHKGSFPITIETPDGIKFDRYVSKYDVYKDSSFYKLRGLVRNVSTLEISELQGTFTYRLADGNQIEDKVSILSRHRPVSRPNDVSEIRELHKITNTTLESVTLKIEIVDSVKAAKNYPPSKEVELNWKGKKKRDIKVRERTQSLGAPSSIGQFFKATWEFENNGPPIRKLKIQARIFDKANELLAEKDMYLTITSAMPIETKGVRIKNTIAKLPKDRFHRYELQVLEIE